MKLIVDQQIPFVSDFFSACGELISLPAEKITPLVLKNADALLIRTVTIVNKNLLENTAVKFVGTTATGTDHIDQHYLKQAGIVFADAAGCNAHAVLKYVLRCVNHLINNNLLQKNTAGIIGLGRIGSLVADALKKLGFEIIYYDPFVLNQTNFRSVSLETLITRSDLITLHTPLTYSGAYPTYHLLKKNLLDKIKPNAVLMNTARGKIIDEAALFKTNNLNLCLDVWENEPDINLDLLNKTIIATPHIAGYSFEAKYRATEMIYNQMADFFKWPKNKKIILKNNLSKKLISTDFNPISYTRDFKQKLNNASNQNTINNIFISERKNFPLF